MTWVSIKKKHGLKHFYLPDLHFSPKTTIHPLDHLLPYLHITIFCQPSFPTFWPNTHYQFQTLQGTFKREGVNIEYSFVPPVKEGGGLINWEKKFVLKFVIGHSKHLDNVIFPLRGWLGGSGPLMENSINFFLFFFETVPKQPPQFTPFWSDLK